jgi:hypothetical protein
MRIDTSALAFFSRRLPSPDAGAGIRSNELISPLNREVKLRLLWT